MRHSALILGAFAATLAATSASARPTGEQELAKLLAGREAGKPVSCITFSDQQNMRVIDRTAIVFGWGNTIYVNRPQNPKDLDSNKIIVTKSWTSNLCNVDIVHLKDRDTMMESGFISLGDFVPYTLPPKG